MAANINNTPQRFDYARAERDDENNQGEAATPDGQTAQPAEANIAAPVEQRGQSSSDGGGSDAGTYDPSGTPPPVEAKTTQPSFARYGLGDTVIMGRPDYTFARPCGCIKQQSRQRRIPTIIESIALAHTIAQATRRSYTEARARRCDWAIHQPYALFIPRPAHRPRAKPVLRERLGLWSRARLLRRRSDETHGAHAIEPRSEHGPRMVGPEARCAARGSECGGAQS
jgi:hypothetical protein